MTTENLDALKQQLSALTPQQKTHLANYLLRQVEQEASQNLLAETSQCKRQKRLEWLKSHREEYGGMYVALDGDVLLGVGKTYAEAATFARDAGVKNAFVDFLPPIDYVGSMGGW
ncbi:MAG: hypothetical protein AB1757_13695 [Acidobacteriota bacterium]